MAFLVIPEIMEMINKLELYIKNAKSNIQRRYYESALASLTQLLETMRNEQNGN